MALLLLTSCAADPPDPVATPNDELADSTATFVRRPLAFPELMADSAAELTFSEARFDFGRVRAGRRVRHRFTFANTGASDLRITAASATCGCTIARYPEQAIAPGERGQLEVVFQTTGQRGRQARPVVVQANTTPAQTVVYLCGEVLP